MVASKETIHSTFTISMSFKSLRVLMQIQLKILRLKCKILLKSMVLFLQKLLHLYLKHYGYVIRSLKVLRSKAIIKESFYLQMRIIQVELAQLTSKWHSKEPVIYLH